MAQHSGTIRFEFSSGRAAENVAFVVNDADVPLLRSFLEEARTLEELARSFKTPSAGFTLSARVGEGASLQPREPDVLERAALLHHLRPFVLQDEPFSFFTIRNLVANATQGDFIRERLRELKRMFGGQMLQEQMKVLSGQMLINSEATLQKWLNAFQYHRDADKAAELEKAFAQLPDGITRPILFMLLLHKADAVRYLGHIVNKIVQVIDSASPAHP